MTPVAIISLIKDVVIVVAIGFVIYILINYGKDLVKVSDMKAVQKQLTDNAATIARWQKESTDADTEKTKTLAQITDTLGKQRAPVFVRGPSCPVSVPPGSTQANNPESRPAAVDTGRGVDYRPVINQFESKYSTALVECYAALDKWPK